MSKRRRRTTARPAARRTVVRRRRVRASTPGCRCYSKCCKARGRRCACGKCRGGREHGKWALYANPPAKRKKQRRKVRSSKVRSSKVRSSKVRSSAGRIKVGVIGRCTAIEYIRGGKRWRHVVEGKSRLLAPKNGGAYIVADGIRVSRFLEG